jgi:LmbE family N-acetylglucosaminyl deacetylase
MKILNQLLVWMAALVVLSCSHKPTVEDLRGFAARETYKEDRFLDNVTNKKGLIIVAHDDDDCAMSGTIAKLTAQGWTIKQLSLTKHVDPKSGENAAHIICKGNEAILEDGIYRMGLDTMKAPYLPIPLEDFEDQFLREKVAQALITKVNSFGPSVLFTLDNIKGGYGHPEHIFLSQLVLDLVLDSSIVVQRIYQSVYTDHMEHTIVDTWLKERMEKWGYPHASGIANKLYGISGMPEPTVQVTITDAAGVKMKYLRAYPEEVRKNLRKFIPYYEEFDAATYFGIFDREFFRVIE